MLEPCSLQIFIKKLLKFVAHRDFLFLAAFFPEPDQRSLSGLKVIFNRKIHDRADAGKSVR